MGCEMTKLVHKRKSDDESGKNAQLPEPPPPVPTDPRLPLTAREKFSLVKSWKAIGRTLEPTGVIMFLKLFEENIQLLSLFDKFKDLKSRDQQAQSLELAEHATVVMSSIDEGIRAMDNVDFFFDLLHQIGASHRKVQGFKKEYFWKIEKPFLEAVKVTLDERYSENISKIYKTTIKFFIQTVIKGYELAEKKESENKSDTNENEVARKEKVSPSSTVLTNAEQEQIISNAIVNIKCSANTSFFPTKAVAENAVTRKPALS